MNEMMQSEEIADIMVWYDNKHEIWTTHVNLTDGCTIVSESNVAKPFLLAPSKYKSETRYAELFGISVS